MARKVEDNDVNRDDVRIVSSDGPDHSARGETVDREPIHRETVHREPVHRETVDREPVHREQSDGFVIPRDSVRWGPVWAGLITTIATFVALELLAFGLGLLSPDLGTGGDGASAWVSGIIGLIAFFTGGAVAGMTSATRGAASGLLNGLMVWALGTVLILVLSSFGLGQIFGALGNLVGQLGAISGGALNNVGGVNPDEILSALRTGALYAFFSLLLSAVAASLGGLLAGRTETPIGHTADTTRRD